MSSDKSYNGWTNYETWNVALWLDNGGAGEMFRERAEELVKSEGKEDAVYPLSKELEEFHDENMPVVTGTYADLLGAALREVDWYSIAQHYVDDVEIEEEDDSSL